VDFGKVHYRLFEAGNGNGAPRALRLTLIGQGDEDVLRSSGLAGLRRRRILRLAEEARLQECLLSYEDLSGLLLTSLATLKRDVSMLEKEGHSVPLRGRKQNGNGRRQGEGHDG
jgi:hypothetical protein